MERYCKYCNQMLVRKIYKTGSIEPKKSFLGRMFCDVDCKDSWIADNKKGDPSNSRRKARELLGPGCCSKCGAEEARDAHRIDGDEFNNSLDNLERLCRSCHTKVHRGKGLCSYEGCQKEHYCKGYCAKHYYRYRKYGDPSVVWVKALSKRSCACCEGKLDVKGGRGLCSRCYKRIGHRVRRGVATEDDLRLWE